MTPVGFRNDLHNLGHHTDNFANRYAALHEPIGGEFLWNGQFEQGPDDKPEGWEVNLYAGGEGTRVTGGVAGNWCFRGGQAGTGRGCWIESLLFIPVYEHREYFLSAWFKGSSASASVYFGVECYDANKASLGNAYVLSAYTPGVAWVHRQMRVGPLGDVAMLPGTRYVRVVVVLQYDVTLTGAYAYVDDVEFSQVMPCCSPQLTLTNGVVSDATDRTFNTTGYVVHAGSPITLTFEEPGYLWYSYNWIWSNTVTRTSAIYARPYLDGGAETAFVSIGCTAAYYYSNSVMQRSVSILARGNHTVDMRFRVITAGDVCTVYQLDGTAWYTRAY